MPRLVEASTEQVGELAELIETLETGGFDPRDEGNFASFGPALKKLANNRAFLGDLMIAELKASCSGQVRDNQYSAQVMMLHMGRSNFAVRANFWPAANDSIVRNSGTDPFFFNIPHDHNFSFLTVGYLGSGYWSEYYEYAYEKAVGYPGEPVDLTFVEKSRLDQGKVMLYRAHRDIHLQLPADDLSVSLNILGASYSSAFRDQYRFDVERREIVGVLHGTSLEPMLALSAHFGGPEGTDLLTEFSRSHPYERMRWWALRALASAAPSVDDRIAVYEGGAKSGSLLVSALATQELERLNASRSWIEAGPPAEFCPPAP